MAFQFFSRRSTSMLAALCLSLGLTLGLSSAAVSAPQVKELLRSDSGLSAPLWNGRQLLFATGTPEMKSYHMNQSHSYSQLAHCLPSALARGPRNQVIVACQRGLVFVNDRGQVTETYPRPPEEQGLFGQELPPEPLENISAVTQDYRGGLYIALSQSQVPGDSSGRIYYLSPSRKVITPVAVGLNQPAGLTLSADGKSLYVSEAGARRVLRYDVDRTQLKNSTPILNAAQLGGPPGSLALNSKGHLYTAIPGRGQILVSNLMGKKLASLQVEAPYITGFTYTESERRLVISAQETARGGPAVLYEMRL